MATLAEIRAKLLAAENKSFNRNSNGSNRDNTIYPFWNLAEGKESVIRFLPDKDQNNILFWVERNIIKLPFAGVKGESESKPVTVQVPCVEMYHDGSVCPILSEVRGWFDTKDPILAELGRKYWKKRSYIFQGLVIEDGLNETDGPENPIRRFIIGPQIYNLIDAFIKDPELEYTPTDYVNGLDFRLKKGSKGGYADYATSTFARKMRPLSVAEQSIIDTYGLQNLSDFLPKKPTQVELEIIKEMFAASVDGEAYDPDRWGQYYKPYGLSQSGTAQTNYDADEISYGSAIVQPAVQTVINTTVQPVIETITQPVIETVAQPTQSSSSDSRAQDILARIRNREST